MRWPEVALGDVCEFKYGKSLPTAKRADGDVPVFGSNGQVGAHSQALTDGPTIIIGRKGSLGEVHFSDRPCWPIDTTYYVDRTATQADLRWLKYRLDGLGLTGLNRAAAIPGLNRADAYRTKLLLPSLPDQRRIAATLDSAEVLRAKRREALVHLDDLTQSIFLETFGGFDSRDWPVTTVADVALPKKGSIRTGPFGSQLLHGEFVSSGVRVLGIDNTVGNEFRWKGRRFISKEKYKQLHRYTVLPGDVLITIMGTCGRCAVVPDNMPTAINTKHLCCITLDHDKCLPVFLHSYFLRHPMAQRYLRRKTKGAIMSGLNMDIVKKLPIAVPPLKLQCEFARRVEGVERLKVQHRAHLAELDALFASLQYRAFRGEL